MSDLEDIPPETPLSPEEAVVRRHRREKKELQGKILAMKKSVTKNDKKKKKDLTGEFAQMEAELAARHKTELDVFRINRSEEIPANPLVQKISELAVNEVADNTSQGDNLSAPGTPRMSKARKRREKKDNEERERQKRIEQETELLVENSDRKKEDTRLKEILQEMNLEVHDISPDGHCLYAAISHQLDYHKGQTQNAENIASLRSKTSSYLLHHREEFINYLDENIGKSDEGFEKYCRDIIETSCWGGQIEVQVLSKVLGKQIRVIQAEGPCLVFGEENSKPSLDLTYHRHMLQLGAHYNSAISLL